MSVNSQLAENLVHNKSLFESKKYTRLMMSKMIAKLITRDATTLSRGCGGDDLVNCLKFTAQQLIIGFAVAIL